MAECPDLTQENFKILWERVCVLERRLSAQSPPVKVEITKKSVKGCNCEALVWNGGLGARCSKSQSDGNYCRAHAKAIREGKHKHGTLESPCERFKGKTFDLSKSKPDKLVKPKKTVKGEVKSVQTEENIRTHISQMLQDCQSLTQLEELTPKRVIDSLGWKRLEKGVSTLLERVLEELKTPVVKRFQLEKQEAPKSEEAEDEDEDEEDEEEIDCDPLEINGVTYWWDRENNNVYNDDSEYVGKYIDGKLQKLPQD